MNTRWMPRAAGILDLLCCLFFIPLLLFFVIRRTIVFEFYPLVMTLSILAGFLAIIGGIITLKRKRWWMAIVGSLAAVVIFLPFMFTQNDSNFFLILVLICGFLGLISLILVLLSRNQFKGEA